MDIGIIGIGIAVTFAIIALSAITLYLAFRIRETFKEGSSPKTQIAKTAFLIGILFLASGMFYFFAQSMPQPENPEKPQSITNNSGTIKLESPAKKASVFFNLSYPDSVKTKDTFIVSFNIYNPSVGTIHDATINVGDLSLFEAKSNFNINSDVLYLGNLPAGEINGYLRLKSPSKPAILEEVLTLRARDIDAITKTIKINILEDNQRNNKKKNPKAKILKKWDGGEDEDD